MATAGGRVHITVNGTTHDVTDWLAFHPGGSQIIQSYAGRDATDVFMVMHSQGAYEKLERMARAWPERVKNETVVESELDKDFRALNAELHREGLYRCSKLWYLYKCSTTLMIGMLGFYISAKFNQCLLGALLCGLMFQQLGWLCHDICHHEMFTDRKIGDWFSLFFGLIMNGFSPTWWKNKHNTHHATTNVIGADPDIDNLPYLAFDPYDLERATPSDLKLIRWQGWYFHIVIAFLKVSWMSQSVSHALNAKKHPNMYFRKQYKREMAAMIMHYTWFSLACILCTPTLLKALMFFVVAIMAGGYFIAFVVLMNHMHLPKLCAKKKFPEWVRLQIATTVNVKRGVLTDWFFGGLNYQVEHHMFPNMPRHNLGKTTSRLVAICKKHNVPYDEPDILTAYRNLMNWVDGLAKDSVKVLAAKRA